MKKLLRCFGPKIEKWIYEDNTCWKVFATPLSALFKVAVAFRHFLFDIGFLKTRQSKAIVVSIGNIVAGGVGKTPVALFLAKALEPIAQVAILTRGYGAYSEKKRDPLHVNSQHSALEIGDEAFLLAKNCNAFVISGKNRLKSTQLAWNAGAKVILLDDGMQHRRLRRDIEIVVVNGSNPLGGSYFLPKGLLRDDPKRLRFADLVVMNGEGEKELIQTYTQAPIVEIEHIVEEIIFFDESEKMSLKNKKVGIFCGIGNPERFVKTVNDLEMEIVEKKFLFDHEKIGERELYTYAQRCKEKGAVAVLCTEKDSTKLEGMMGTSIVLPLVWVKMNVTIKKNRQAFDVVIENIKTRLSL